MDYTSHRFQNDYRIFVIFAHHVKQPNLIINESNG